MAIVSSGPEQKHAIRARARRIIGVFIVGVLIVASMYLYNYVTTANRFAIEKIELAGLSRVDPASLQRVVADLKGQNILLAPLDEVEARLESQPRIASVECRRVLPNRVIYSISEREPVALVYTDRFFEIDAAGTQCPNILFPYVRQLVSDLIQAGGFPPFFLQPINFEGLYAETLRQRQEQGDAPSLADSEPAGNA